MYHSNSDWNARRRSRRSIKIRKRLCLLMMSLLLFMSAGCSQITPQTLETPATEASESASRSVIAIESNSGDRFNNDNPGNSEESSLPDNAETGTESNDDNSNSGEDYSLNLPEDESYTSKEDVALYIHLYGHLPPNFITKKEAEELGWKGGSLETFAPGKCIGGNRFGNYEGLLPQADGRSYTECDIDTLGADKRGAKRIVFSNDGLIYYTEDHYKSFELLYGEVDP